MMCVVAVLAIGACTPVGCTPPKPAPPKTHACALQDGITRANSGRLSPSQAASNGAAAFEAAEADPGIDADGDIPLAIVVSGADGLEYTSVPVADEDEAREVARRAAERSEVVAVEPDLPVSLFQTAPNDPLYPKPAESGKPGQWALFPSKTTFLQAAAIADGTDVVVAVLDTGVDASHPDLAGRVLPGRNFSNQGTSTNTNDDNGHGTHVAGIIAANTNNSVGIAGAAPGVKILPVKVMNSAGSGQITWVVNGMKWARENGADVITMSLGSAKSTLYWNEITGSWSSGVVMVAAVGNDGNKTAKGYAKGVHCSWPAGYDQVLGVASVDESLHRSSFSTRGLQIDLAAPGARICSTVPTWAVNISSSIRCRASQSNLYALFDGTSMAAPYVASAVAMLVDHCPKPNNSAASTFYRLRMRKSGHWYPSKNIDLGYGRMSPAKALAGSCATA